MVWAKDLREEIADVRVETDADGVVWWATSELRWLDGGLLNPESGERLAMPRRLQQLWHGSGDREQWRDVPIASEQPR